MKNLVLDMRSVAKIRVLCLLSLALLTGSSAFAATYTVAKSGKWNQLDTWEGTAPDNTITKNEDITIIVPDEMTLTIDEDVTITQNGLYIITLSGAGTIEITGTSKFSLINDASTAAGEKNKNRANLQCDINIEENATLELDVLNVAFDSEYNINGSGTIWFSRTGSYSDNRCRIQIANLKKPIKGCKFLYASPQKFTYESSSDYVLPGEYYDMGSRKTPIYVYDNVIVTHNSYIENSGNQYISKSNKAKISFNTFSNSKALTFNVDVTLKNISGMSSLTVADTNKLTITGTVTWNNNFTLPKKLVIANGGTLTINNTPALSENITIENGGTLNLTGNVTLSNNISIADGGMLNLGGSPTLSGNIDIANGGVLKFYNDNNRTITFNSGANITGNGQMLFAGNATINSLTTCIGREATFAEDKSISYAATSTHIIPGTYNNLTTNSGTLTLCGNVVVDGTYKITNDIIINGEIGNETITFNGSITNTKSLTLGVNAIANEANSYSISALNIASGKSLTINGDITVTSDLNNISGDGTIHLNGSLTFNKNAKFYANKTITGSGNLTFNGYVYAVGAKLTTYANATMANVNSDMYIDTIEVKGGKFEYLRNKAIRSLIVDGGEFELNPTGGTSINVNGIAELKSGTLKVDDGKTMKINKTVSGSDTLKVTGTAIIDGGRSRKASRVGVRPAGGWWRACCRPLAFRRNAQGSIRAR